MKAELNWTSHFHQSHREGKKKLICNLLFSIGYKMSEQKSCVGHNVWGTMCSEELIVRVETAKTSKVFWRAEEGHKRRSKANIIHKPHKVRKLHKDSLFVCFKVSSSCHGTTCKSKSEKENIAQTGSHKHPDNRYFPKDTGNVKKN